MIEVDYSVYLVTDSGMVPESSTFMKQIEGAIAGGATLIQLREKKLSTSEFISKAREIHELTKASGIPLIINDRIDVALAIDAEGVHVGQDDMPASLARKLLGPDKIVGVTCSNVEEINQVCQEGISDYVGIGTVYPTNTKKDVKDPDGTGPIGIRKMLRVLKNYNDVHKDKPIKNVAIGGINTSNVAKVLYQCQYKDQKLDGLAIVSCIMAAEDSKTATEMFKLAMKTPVPWAYNDISKTDFKPQPETARLKVRNVKPLVHHITNNVVKNFSANVTLAIGASPIMSELGEEFEEFASTVPNLSLLINLGTPTQQLIELFIHAVQTYNQYGKPILFDPVAAGATAARLSACKKILNAGQMTVIKGNLGEILAIWKLTAAADQKTFKIGDSVTMRGVDSISLHVSQEALLKAMDVSEEFRCIVVVTGEINYVVDASIGRIQSVKGGHSLMGSVTGTGCSLGSVIAAYLALEDRSHSYTQTYNAVGNYNASGYKASKIIKYVPYLPPAQDIVEASGSFMTSFLDTLSYISLDRVPL